MFRWFRFTAGIASVSIVFGPLSALGESPKSAAPLVKTTPTQGTPKTGDLPLESMLGPYPTIAAYCAAGTQPKSTDDRYHCIPSPNRWDAGTHRGPRGHFLSARLLRVGGKLGPHTVEFCRIAMQSSQGWFVSNHALPCKGQAPGGKVKSTAVSLFRWADEIAPGILMVHAQHTDEVENESWRWWGSESIKRDSEPSRTSFTLCGMSLTGIPSCAPALDLCGDDPIVVSEGRIEVPQHHMSPLYCLVAWPPGIYTLKLQGAQPGPRPWAPNGVPSQDESDREEKGLLAATPAYGPFRSVTEYCQDLPSFEFDVRSPKDNPTRERCSPRPGWSGALKGHGPLLEGQLLSVYSQEGVVPVHYCRVALHTSKGWFVTASNEPCRGEYVPDEMSTGLADTWAQPLRWLDHAKGGVLLIDSIHSDPNGKCRQVQVCGVGPSGIPSCTSVVGAGSKDSREIQLTSSQLKIVPRVRSVPRPDEEDDTISAADAMCYVPRDSYELSFP